VQRLSGGFCSVCGERIASPYAFSDLPGGEQPRCGICRRIEPVFARAAAYGSYDGALRELIHLLKYNRIRPAANVLGRMLAEVIESLQPGFGDASLIVVPVPLHARRVKQRGFNHSELLASAACKVLRSPHLHVIPAVLERSKDTVSQTGLTRHQRQENMRGAFTVAAPSDIRDREVLLVDDVFTTGTTAAECARVLRRAGASKVWVATVARTLKAENQFARVGSGKTEELSLAARA
jgi:ComF family protein